MLSIIMPVFEKYIFRIKKWTIVQMYDITIIMDNIMIQSDIFINENNFNELNSTQYPKRFDRYLNLLLLLLF